MCCVVEDMHVTAERWQSDRNQKVPAMSVVLCERYSLLIPIGKILVYVCVHLLTVAERGTVSRRDRRQLFFSSRFLVTESNGLEPWRACPPSKSIVDVHT